jgi:hypothetical protein
MSWYGNPIICPNCKCEDEGKCRIQYRNNMTESLYLLCQKDVIQFGSKI